MRNLSKTRSRAGAAMVALSALLPTAASAGSFVNIQFCNNFGQKVFVAIAYPQDDTHWLSRGWMSVENGECSAFDTALHVPTFYVRAQTDWYPEGRNRARETWGGKGDRSFAVIEDLGGTFNYYQAEVNYPGTPNEPFFSFMDGAAVTMEGNANATVTFNADGSTTSNMAPIVAPKTTSAPQQTSN